ncbi:MAG: NUDIX domain-containing protein, partial [Phycisphaerae bacterium]|nr:NUDIX domain-containing protein [Phycisphaerae bacterium]
MRFSDLNATRKKKSQVGFNARPAHLERRSRSRARGRTPEILVIHCGVSQVPNLPYKIATLVDLRDDRGRVLLLERRKAPNHGLFSPIGGKLDMATGESPAMCARREVMEEAGLDLPIERFHLLGMISETAFEGRGHWLIFYYRVMGPVWVEPHDMREGRLDWHEVGAID